MARQSKAAKSTRNKRTAKQRQRARVLVFQSLRTQIGIPFGVISFLIASMGVVSFFPRLSVSQRGSVREHEALATIFDVTNQGLFPLKDLEIDCGADRLRSSQWGGIRGISFAFPESRVARLEPAQTVTADCDRMIKGDQTLHGTMSVRVSYRPFLWPSRRGKKFLMASVQTDQGTWIWKFRGTSDFTPLPNSD